MEKDIFGVSDFLAEARKLLEASYPYIWIEGEISTLRQPASGHIYFSLKDEKSQVRCAFFRRSRSLSGYQPVEGDLVRVKARVTIYEARGDFQLIVQEVEEAGEGLLMRRFEELKKKLADEGLFDSERKKSLPRFPGTVGILSSPTGAAIRDVIATIGRRFPLIRLVIYPSVVQGDSAPGALRTALADAVRHKRADILIITRGGGSLEDLWCFNDEELARDIAACPIPVVSAVGHEIDFTICDFVSDHRAPTPTAAGEFVSPDGAALRDTVMLRGRQLLHISRQYLQSLNQKTDWLQRSLVHPSKRVLLARERVDGLARRQVLAAGFIVEQWRGKLANSQSRIRSHEPRAKIQEWRRRLGDTGLRLHRAQATELDLLKTRQSGLAHRLGTVSPLATLGRGYSISTIPDTGSIVRTLDDLNKKNTLDVRITDAVLHCHVKTHTPVKE